MSRKLKVIQGGLLHDIGKPAYRGDRAKNHSMMGYEFLKDTAKITDTEILEQVKYHHANMLKNSSVADNSLAYITYIADNIASGADRRKTGDDEYGFDMQRPLDSVFNRLNGNNQNYTYNPYTMEDGINYPSEESKSFSNGIYNEICDRIQDCLKGIDTSSIDYANSLLEVMEACCTFVPSSTAKGEAADISLYDHCKITAAVGSCIYDYLEENGIENYKQELYKGSKEFYKKPAFLMYSFDISGIQDFIYTISSKGTLKMLRSRSFYLELLCEHFIDTILSRLEYSRTNLIYSGGGHGYILLANTNHVKTVLEELGNQFNEWCMSLFKISLYSASAYTECSADDLMNTNGSYEDIFKRISRKLSDKKANRYTSSQIMQMNKGVHVDGSRECRICKRSDYDIKNDVCVICDKLGSMSDSILEDDFFVIMENDDGLPLPFGCSIAGTGMKQLVGEYMNRPDYLRCYCKNEMFTGKCISSKLWVGDYYTEKEFGKLANKSEGIERIGIIRADVDNLGKAFVSGFDEKYVSLSRTAVFSRKLSIFFKKHISEIFERGSIDKDASGKGIEGLIVYSGGDDVFLVTAWSDAIRAAMLMKESLEKFTQGTLTISAGIGIYSAKYPIAAMARESGELESESKHMGRNRVTLFSSSNSESEKYTYVWNELRDKVIAEKKEYIKKYFDNQSEHGKGLLYNLLDYLRSVGNDKINIARYAYMLSRLEPDYDASEEEKAAYKEFSKKMYMWMINSKDRFQLITAIYLYVYSIRDKDRSDD